MNAKEKLEHMIAVSAPLTHPCAQEGLPYDEEAKVKKLRQENGILRKELKNLN